ncbi:hypothetical protein R1flu_025129 [Riccia fluitans]|uniref:Phosphate transporter PHO1 n=1 Tax=Riccia fluitans TaxID=41844 RepID=A0ABD1XX20_9MARC
MVKFSKQLEGQLVPEWRPAYVNYKNLKKELKRLKQQPSSRKFIPDGVSQSFRAAMNFTTWPELDSSSRGQEASTSSPAAVFPSDSLPSDSPSRSRLLPQPSRAKESFESLLALGGHAAHALRSRSQKRRLAQEVIQVHVHPMEGNAWEVYETILLEPLNRMEAAKVFFARLDAQFNKVNQFFRGKEKEFVEQAQTLEKQMQALVEMRKALEEHPDQFSASPKENCGSSEELSVTGNHSISTTDLEAGDASLEGERHKEIRGSRSLDPCSSSDGENEYSLRSKAATGLVSEAETGGCSKSSTIVTPMGMRIRIPRNTPGTTISALSQALWDEVLKQGGKTGGNPQPGESQITLTKKKLQMAEKMLRSAFIEYYRGLNFLKSYSSLNMVAFTKILKKFDKVSGYRASAVYLKVVETSYFNSSDKIITLLEKVENLYTQYFAKYNRHKAMLSLRPMHKKASHTVTFILGVFVGGSLALLVVFAVLVRLILPNFRAPGDQKQEPGEVPHTVYLTTIFPVFSMIMLILIHMYMYGANLYLWRRLRINYAFIFEFAPGTELRHRQVLMVTSVLTTVTIGCMVGHLGLHSVNKSPYVDFIPLAVVMLMVGILFFPLNILYRSSRVFFLNSMLHIIGSPLYKVVLADFFLADQLTSQVPMFRNMQYVLCYYIGGFFKTGNSDGCYSNNQFKGLTYLISLLPYWWRFMQCARRFIEERDRAHIANGGKYLSALVAVILRIQYGRTSSVAWAFLFVLSSAVATVYQVYWDLVVDWGLLRKKSSNKWLRDQLIMPKGKVIYFISMILNVLLRMAWLQSVTRFRFGVMDPQVADFIFAALEVIRRGHWNFYRLENEHLNNVGSWRAAICLTGRGVQELQGRIWSMRNCANSLAAEEQKWRRYLDYKILQASDWFFDQSTC